jgi:hypothetical protein
MSDYLHDNLCPTIDALEVEASIPAQVANLTLLVPQLLLRSEGTDNPRTPKRKQRENIHEPTTYVNAPGGSEGNTTPSFTSALPDDAYLDPRE